jgi:hypothetical protein
VEEVASSIVLDVVSVLTLLFIPDDAEAGAIVRDFV